MKRAIFIIPIATIFLVSCKKVINVDLNAASPQYVIEGQVFEGTDTVHVHIAKTTDFYGKQPQEMVNDAVVTLTDDGATAISVPFKGNGDYELGGYTAAAGHVLQLKVSVAGREFTATSTVPHPVSIDSLTYVWKKADFLEEGYEVAARLTDPGGVANYYRLLHSTADDFHNQPGDLYLFNDKFNDGKPVKADLPRRFEPGSEVRVEIRTMDKGVFDFYTSLNDALNNQGGPAPANPNSNITGGALGYFGAFTSAKMNIVLPQ